MINKILIIAIIVVSVLIIGTLIFFFVFDGNLQGESPPETSVCSCIEDLDCSDFLTQQEAQACFEHCGGVDNDFHRLDADGNGVACESLGGGLV